MVKKSTKRVDAHRKREAERGRFRREYSATEPEHSELKKRLKELRTDDSR